MAEIVSWTQPVLPRSQPNPVVIMLSMGVLPEIQDLCDSESYCKSRREIPRRLVY
jgi:hypothetical protein